MENKNDISRKLLVRKNTFIALLLLFLFAGFAAGCGAAYVAVTGAGSNVIVEKQSYNTMHYMYNKYMRAEELYRILDASYYKDINENDIMTGIYKGMYNAVGDPYTTYMTADEYEKFTVDSIGDFSGVGLTMVSRNNEIVVTSTVEGSPAANAGIRMDDVITHVDGVAYKGEQLSEAASHMRGQLNTKVEVTYRRGSESKTVTLIRKEIETESVYSEMLDGNIGYIRITQFVAATAEDFRHELDSMEAADVSGLVIDVRMNGGGIVQEGIEIADMLLPECTLVYLEDKAGQRRYFNSDAACTDIPFIILVDGGTASTSEILAASVKDNKDGCIVGTQTFGKGIIQTSTVLQDGSGAVKITTSQYFSADGNRIHEVGVYPDHVVDFPEDAQTDVQLEKALELLQ